MEPESAGRYGYLHYFRRRSVTATTQNPENPRDTGEQVRRFLSECTIRDPEDGTVLPVADLYGMYIIWCEETEAEHLSVQAFSALVRAEGIDSGVRHRERVFKGVLATGPIPIQYILETDKGPGPNSPLGVFPL